MHSSDFISCRACGIFRAQKIFRAHFLFLLDPRARERYSNYNQLLKARLHDATKTCDMRQNRDLTFNPVLTFARS